MAKTTVDVSVLPADSPTIAGVRKAQAKAADDLVKARNAQARPGVKWSWAWGSRGIQLTVSVLPGGPGRAAAPEK